VETKPPSEFWLHLAVPGMNDLRKEKEEMSSQHEIRILVSFIPGELQPRPSVESEEEYFLGE